MLKLGKCQANTDKSAAQFVQTTRLAAGTARIPLRPWPLHYKFQLQKGFHSSHASNAARALSPYARKRSRQEPWAAPGDLARAQHYRGFLLY